MNDSLLRGGEPGVAGIEQLGALGVKTVIDLREMSPATETEKKEADRLGMKYINVPLRQFSAPTAGQMQQLLGLLLRPNAGLTFVHCRRGKDRTGTVIACYRIQHDGWTNERALREARQHGMSMAERGMQSYILRFAPLIVPMLQQITQ